jgi:hypothetical protein
MNVRPLAALCSAIVVSGGVPIIAVAAAAPAAAPAPAPAEDNLKLVSSSQLQRLYLAPGADLGHITGLILEPTEVAFRDNWVRDFNRTRRGGSGRLTDTRAEQIKNDASQGLGDVFTNAFRNAGYQMVQAPGPGVLRIRPHIINLAITAPDVRVGRSQIWSRDAGEAMLVLDVMESRSNALLARALDRRILSSSQVSLRNAVTNRSDFQRLFETWARSAVEDLGALKKAAPPR